MAPANDLFANRIALPGAAAVVSTYNTRATTEPNEPSIGERATSRSLWWSWTAPASGWANFSTFGSDGPLATGVFVGDSLAGLSAVGLSGVYPWYARYGFSWNASSELVRGDTVSVPVRAGETYQIVVAVPARGGEAASSMGRVILGINQPPAILSGATVSGSVGRGIFHQIRASNSPLEFFAENLPPGLTLNRYTGEIRGAPTTVGSFEAVVLAKNPGGIGRATVRFEISAAITTPRAPEFRWSRSLVEGAVGESLFESVSTENTPTALTVDALPPGLSMTPSSLGSSSAYARISGTPTAAGTFRTKIRAANATGAADAEITFRIRATLPLPVFYSSATGYGTTGADFSYWLSANDMTAGTYEIGALPAGLAADGRSIRGTPTEAGVFEVPVKATNAAGTTTATLTLVITAPTTPEPATSAPTLTSAGGAFALQGSSFAYRIATDDPGAQFAASGLPAGLRLDPATGRISGTPTETGNFTANVTATNALGTTTATLSFFVQSRGVSPISSPAMAVGTLGRSFSYQFPWGYASPRPPFSPSSPSLTVDASALPPGLRFQSSASPFYQESAAIVGTPTAIGTYRIPVTATSNGIPVPATLTIVIRATSGEPPVITSAASAPGHVGESFSHSLTASNQPGGFTATNLPPGLSLSASNGRITGTPTQAGTFVVDLTAANDVGASRAKLTLSIAPPRMGTFYGDAVVEGIVGQSLTSYAGYSNPVPDLGPATHAAENLPPGLSLSATTGQMTGWPTQAGTFSATFTATNAGGTSRIVRTFLIAAAPSPPVISSDLMAEGSVGESFHYSAYASGSSPTFAFGPLPPGLTAEGSSLRGTPTQAGTFEVAITATNAGGSRTAFVTLRIGPPKPPRLDVPASHRVLLGGNFDYGFSSANAVTSRAISGRLPEGVTFDAERFRLSGTPTQIGAYPLKITASGPGGTTTAPFLLLVEAPELPVITAPLVCYQYHYSGAQTYLSASNNPTSFSASGLPASLRFTSYGNFASVTGSLAVSGIYPVTITAGNAGGSNSAVVHFTNDLNLLDGFNNAMVTATLGQTFSYRPYTGVAPYMTARVFSATDLPPGLTIDPVTGTITGTPTAAGSYLVPFTAKYPTLTSVPFTLRILVQAASLPVITETSVIAGAVGQSLRTSLTGSGGVTGYAVDVVPPGLAFDPDSGLLTGTPTVAGSYPVKFSATNAAGTRTVDLAIEIAAAPPAPLITSDAAFHGVVGDRFSGSLYAWNAPTSFAAVGLPPGLVLDPANGNIRGTSTAAGDFVVDVTATNAGGTAAARLTFHVAELPVPVIANSVEIATSVGSSFTRTIIASPAPTTFSASNLPPGLTLEPATGEISGQPTTAGDYLVPVSATNAAGTGPATLTIRVRPPAVWLSSPAAEAGLVGEYLLLPLYDSEKSDSTITVEALPPGLTSDGRSISGRPTEAGEFVVPVRVLRGSVETRASLTLHVAEAPLAPPVIRGALTAGASAGASFSYAINASNRPTRFTAEGLPDGIVLDAARGTLTGSPSRAGRSEITLTATNEIGSSTAVVTLITSAPLTPIVTTRATVQATAGQPFADPVDVSAGFPFGYPFYPDIFSRDEAAVLPYTLTARGLPPGLFLNPVTEQLEGTATTPGDYDVALTAATALSEVTTTIRLRVGEAPAAASTRLQISSGVTLNAFGAVGSPFDLSVTPVGLATDVTTSELPPGLVLAKTMGTSNGVRTLFAELAGTPTKPGTYPVRFTFSHAARSASATVTIVIPEIPEPPAVTHPLVATGTVGQSFFTSLGDGETYRLNNAATQHVLPELPPGLAFNARTFQITGTPTQAGRFFVPVSLTNAGGTAATTLTIAIAGETPLAPAILGGNGESLVAAQIAYAGESLAFGLRTANTADELSAAGLPEGLTLRKNAAGSWTLAGTPARPGVFPILLTRTGTGGGTTVPLTLDIRALDQSTPAPPPDPTPPPTPPGATSPEEKPTPLPPILVLSAPDLRVTIRPAVTLRGKILRYTAKSTLHARRSDDTKWQRVRVSPSGRFTLRADRLPLGPTTILMRLVPPTGKASTKKIRIFRSPG